MSTLGLLVLALPLIEVDFANSDARSLPASTPERRADDAYRSLFAPEVAPVTIVAAADVTTVVLRDYLNALNRRPDVLRLELRPDVPAGSVIIDLTPDGAGERSRALVSDVRAAGAPFPVLVGGAAAEVLDYRESVAARLPYAVLVVVVAMLVLLFLLTRSVVVPVKAVLLNALTFLATLGVLVAVFQWGWGEPVLRFDSWGAIDLTTPLLLFVFIFGLTMDYEVFLLSRIKEEYDRRPNNDRAVLAGIAAIGPGGDRRRPLHHHRLSRLRRRRAGPGQGDRRRDGRGGDPRCHRRAWAAAAGHHDAVRGSELVDTALAPAARRSRGHHAAQAPSVGK